jgi:hypothetical protein
MENDFSIGIGRKAVTPDIELPPELPVVVDFSVEDDHERTRPPGGNTTDVAHRLVGG